MRQRKLQLCSASAGSDDRLSLLEGQPFTEEQARRADEQGSPCLYDDLSSIPQVMQNHHIFDMTGIRSHAGLVTYSDKELEHCKQQI